VPWHSRSTKPGATFERSIRVVTPGLPALRARLALGGEMFVASSHLYFAAWFMIRRLCPLLEANRSFFLAGGAEAAWVSVNYTPEESGLDTVWHVLSL
jgi:hypothetical protein